MDGYITVKLFGNKSTFDGGLANVLKEDIVKINNKSVARKQGQATGVKVNQGDLVQHSYADLKTNHSKLWTAVVTQVTPYKVDQAVKTVVCRVMEREKLVFLHALETSQCPLSLPQKRNAAWQ